MLKTITLSWLCAASIVLMGCGAPKHDELINGARCGTLVRTALGEARFRTGRWLTSLDELERIVPGLRLAADYKLCREITWTYADANPESESRSVSVKGVKDGKTFAVQSGAYGPRRGVDWICPIEGIDSKGQEVLLDDEVNAAVALASEALLADEKVDSPFDIDVSKIVNGKYHELIAKYNFKWEFRRDGKGHIFRVIAKDYFYDFPFVPRDLPPMRIIPRSD